MTPRLLTWGEGETVVLSMVREKLSVLDNVDLVPMRRTSVYLYIMRLEREREREREIYRDIYRDIYI